MLDSNFHVHFLAGPSFCDGADILSKAGLDLPFGVSMRIAVQETVLSAASQVQHIMTTYEKSACFPAQHMPLALLSAISCPPIRHTAEDQQPDRFIIVLQPDHEHPLLNAFALKCTAYVARLPTDLIVLTACLASWSLCITASSSYLSACHGKHGSKRRMCARIHMCTRKHGDSCSMVSLLQAS